MDRGRLVSRDISEVGLPDSESLPDVDGGQHRRRPVAVTGRRLGLGALQTAMRVKRSRPALPRTTMALIAATPVGVAEDGRLRLRVWGGREFGTVLRLSASATSAAGKGDPVTLTAPADTWTTFTVRLTELSDLPKLGRIDLAVATEQLPNTNRFFLDDITVLG